jgi:tripartite-type tricarboxylate transporter receptor subunit TctC
VAYLKANAAKLNYGTGGVGATSHLTCLFLDSLLDVKPQHVPFPRLGPGAQRAARRADRLCVRPDGRVVPQIQAGQAKGLGSAVKNRLPTCRTCRPRRAGPARLPGTGWNALFAPKGTPAPIVARLNEAARAALANEGTRKRLLELGAELPDAAGQTPALWASSCGPRSTNGCRSSGTPA